MSQTSHGRQNLRQKQEAREHRFLSPHASFADQSLGRDRKEERCDIRTDYQETGIASFIVKHFDV